MKKTRKLLVVALLMFLVAAASGGAYAYWAGTINNPADKQDTDGISITVGVGADVATHIEINNPVLSNKILVPAGRSADGSSEPVAPSDVLVEQLVYNYGVDWKRTSGGIGTGTEGTLTVKVTNLKVGGVTDSDALALVNIVDENSTASFKAVGGVSYTTKIKLEDATSFDVPLKVTITEPANKAEYDKIANKTITFDVTFSIAQ